MSSATTGKPSLVHPNVIGSAAQYLEHCRCADVGRGEASGTQGAPRLRPRVPGSALWVGTPPPGLSEGDDEVKPRPLLQLLGRDISTWPQRGDPRTSGWPWRGPGGCDRRAGLVSIPGLGRCPCPGHMLGSWGVEPMRWEASWVRSCIPLPGLL